MNFVQSLIVLDIFAALPERASFELLFLLFILFFYLSLNILDCKGNYVSGLSDFYLLNTLRLLFVVTHVNIIKIIDLKEKLNEFHIN